MLISSSVRNHLSKYFDLARGHYEEKDWGLAAFFAVTVIEECAKILILRDANPKSKKQREYILNHSQKHFSALINLIDQSERFDALPKEWQDQAWSWFSGGELSTLRNKGLYVWFDSGSKELTVPNETVSPKDAALLVYLAGFAAVELGQYVDIDSVWVDDKLNKTATFRQKYLTGA